MKRVWIKRVFHRPIRAQRNRKHTPKSQLREGERVNCFVYPPNPSTFSIPNGQVFLQQLHTPFSCSPFPIPATLLLSFNSRPFEPFGSMAVSTSFAGAKLEALLLKASSSSAATTSSTSRASTASYFPRPIWSRRSSSIQRGVRCEVAASDVAVQGGSSNISALEQLKTSAADSTFLSSSSH